MLNYIILSLVLTAVFAIPTPSEQTGRHEESSDDQFNFTSRLNDDHSKYPFQRPIGPHNRPEFDPPSQSPAFYPVQRPLGSDGEEMPPPPSQYPIEWYYFYEMCIHYPFHPACFVAHPPNEAINNNNNNHQQGLKDWLSNCYRRYNSPTKSLEDYLGCPMLPHYYPTRY